MDFYNKQTGEKYTRQQIKDLYNKGKVPMELPLTFGNIKLFNQEIAFYMSFKDGAKWLWKRNQAVIKESLEKGTEMSSKIIQQIGARL